jgi:hypothetical protein
MLAGPRVRRVRARRCGRSGLGIGADAGNENEAGDTGSSSLPRDSFGALLVHRLERYAPRLDIGGDRIDDGVGPGEDGGDRGLVAHVGAEDRNPVQACRVQSAARAVGMPDRDAYSCSLGSEAAHEASTEEAGAPEHADRGHGIPFSMRRKQQGE